MGIFCQDIVLNFIRTWDEYNNIYRMKFPSKNDWKL